jgi:uncharacterized RDD family membrane protein YckC
MLSVRRLTIAGLVMDEEIGNAGKPRIFAFIVDNLIATILSLAAVSALKSENPATNAAALCLTYLCYYLVFETFWSRTPGKFFQRLEVQQLNGDRCGFKAALIRTVLRVFEANPLLFGGLPAGIAVLSSRRKQRLGDILARTIVRSTRNR